MDLVVEHSLDSTSESLFAVVADLGRYPEWMGLVHSARPVGDAIWEIQLRARVGPFARSKKLTMARTSMEVPNSVRFERRESDGRSHGVWTLDVNVRPDGDRTKLVMNLHYGGRLWSSVVERVLFDEIEASKKRLEQLLTL
jgi:ribosome-associated toxin RatA of RatAB toxin-antitoxin module